MKVLEALDAFRSGSVRVLVATDVAARGIDISDLSYVFLYDIPEHVEVYVHRSGRTARAGAEGDAVSFACESPKMRSSRPSASRRSRIWTRPQS